MAVTLNAARFCKFVVLARVTALSKEARKEMPLPLFTSTISSLEQEANAIIDIAANKKFFFINKILKLKI